MRRHNPFGDLSTPTPANALWPALTQSGRLWALGYLIAREDRRRHCLGEPVGKVGKARLGKIGGHAGRSLASPFGAALPCA